MENIDAKPAARIDSPIGKLQSPSQRSFSAILFIVSVSVFFWYIRTSHFPFIDDSYITLRYADNFLHGKGLVFNTGDWLEGFSNPLFLALLIVGGWIGFPLVQLSVALGITAAIFILGYLHFRTHPILGQAPRARHLAPLLLALNPYFASHAVSGLETMLYAAFITFIFFELLQIRKTSPLLLLALFLLPWNRPESLFVGISLITGGFLGGIGKKNYLQQVKSATIQTFCLLFGALALLLIRYWLYNDFLPNTYYAKVGGGLRYFHRSGWAYITTFFTEYSSLGFVLIPGIILFLISNIRVALRFICLSGAILFFIYYVNGDWMYNYRWFTPLLPTITILAALGWAVLISSVSVMRIQILITGALIILGVYQTWAMFEIIAVRPWFSDNPSVIRNLLRARNRLWDIRETKSPGYPFPFWQENSYMMEHTYPGDWVVFTDIGATGYLGELNVIDCKSLVTKKMSRAILPGNESIRQEIIDLFWRVRPKVVYLHDNETYWLEDYLRNSIEFAAQYIQDPDHKDFYLRKDAAPLTAHDKMIRYERALVRLPQTAKPYYALYQAYASIRAFDKLVALCTQFYVNCPGSLIQDPLNCRPIARFIVENSLEEIDYFHDLKNLVSVSVMGRNFSCNDFSGIEMVSNGSIFVQLPLAAKIYNLQIRAKGTPCNDELAKFKVTVYRTESFGFESSEWLNRQDGARTVDVHSGTRSWLAATGMPTMNLLSPNWYSLPFRYNENYLEDVNNSVISPSLPFSAHRILLSSFVYNGSKTEGVKNVAYNLITKGENKVIHPQSNVDFSHTFIDGIEKGSLRLEFQRNSATDRFMLGEIYECTPIYEAQFSTSPEEKDSALEFQTLNSGEFLIQLEFINDAKNAAGEDRNLYIREMTIE